MGDMIKHGCKNYVGHVPMCICGVKGFYSERWDSYYCTMSFVWLDNACNCPRRENCPYAGRPDNAQKILQTAPRRNVVTR